MPTVNSDSLAALARSPRKVTLVCITDGNARDFVDDGASVTADGVFPGGARQRLLACLRKVDGEGRPIYYSLARMAPIEDGRGGTAVPFLDAGAQKRLEANLVERKRTMGEGTRNGLADVRAFLKGVAAADGDITKAIEAITKTPSSPAGAAGGAA